jgi:PAS domain S-box-containing protein
VLLVEDNLAEARLLQEILKGTILLRFQLTHVPRLGEAIALLRTHPEHPISGDSLAAIAPADAPYFDVVLLDLTLPDSAGLASLDTLVQHIPDLPIVVLTNTNDDELAVEAVRHGAQDYLMKRQINQDSLARSLRYAIERKQTARALQDANEILEQRVQERTQEVQTANEYLRREIEWRQLIQERLELAQQAGKIGTFEWSVQSNSVAWSSELEALYGLNPGSFQTGYEIWLKTIHSDDRSRVEQELCRAMRDNCGFDSEFRIVMPQGDCRWIAVKSSMFHNDIGAPLRMIGIHMDITEKKQFEEQFLRAQRLESLGTLASGIAHDLNNILTPILAVVQLLPLKLPNLDDHTRYMLKTLEASAHRGAELVKQILSFTRGVEGKRGWLQMSHLLNEIKDMIQQTLPKSIVIQTDIPTNLWTISGDMTQLHQVFMNLCVNARDAMPQGGILSITAENMGLDERQARHFLDVKPGSYVLVTVSDTGVGISPDLVHRIFDPFFTTKAVGKGTGLGLSAVLGIVESHGGFVDVQSQIGQGSQFHIYLPANSSGAIAISDEWKPLTGQRELILIVDDEVAVRDMVKTMLETFNYQVITAKDGAEAIACVAEHPQQIHAVVMDIMMPSMDGLATISLLRRLDPNVCAIAMSGISSTEVKQQAQQMGFQEFLAKPFSIQELLHTLHPD